MNEILNLYFRHTNDNNTWICRASQGAGTISIVRTLNGVETVVSNVGGQTWTVGTSYRIVVGYDRENIRIYSGTGATSTFKAVYPSGVGLICPVFNSSVAGAKVTISGAGSITKFRAWPRYPSIPTQIQARLPACDQLVICGDSVPTNGSSYFYAAWPTTVRAILLGCGGRTAYLMSPRIVTGQIVTMTNSDHSATLIGGPIWADYGSPATDSLIFSGFTAPYTLNNGTPFVCTGAVTNKMTFVSSSVLANCTGQAGISFVNAESYGVAQSQAADASIDTNCRLKFCIIWAGTNDFFTAHNTSASDVYASLSSFIQGRKAAGYITIVPTMLPRGDAHIATDATRETYRIAYNDLIMANSAGADILVNLGGTSTTGEALSPLCAITKDHHIVAIQPTTNTIIMLLITATTFTQAQLDLDL